MYSVFRSFDAPSAGADFWEHFGGATKRSNQSSLLVKPKNLQSGSVIESDMHAIKKLKQIKKAKILFFTDFKKQKSKIFFLQTLKSYKKIRILFFSNIKKLKKQGNVIFL